MKRPLIYTLLLFSLQPYAWATKPIFHPPIMHHGPIMHPIVNTIPHPMGDHHLTEFHHGFDPYQFHPSLAGEHRHFEERHDFYEANRFHSHSDPYRGEWRPDEHLGRFHDNHVAFEPTRFNDFHESHYDPSWCNDPHRFHDPRYCTVGGR